MAGERESYWALCVFFSGELEEEGEMEGKNGSVAMETKTSIPGGTVVMISVVLLVTMKNFLLQALTLMYIMLFVYIKTTIKNVYILSPYILCIFVRKLDCLHHLN